MPQQSHRYVSPDFLIRKLHWRWSSWLCASLVSAAVQAGVEFHTAPSAFNTAVAGFASRGTEAWSTATATQPVVVTDPLSPGVPKGPFPNGSSAVVGIRVQSNALAHNPTQPSPGAGLFYAPAGFTGTSGNTQPTKQLSVWLTNDSFDIIFTTIGQKVSRAVSLSPMYYRIFSPHNAGTIGIRVYNQANQFLGNTIITNVPDCLESAYVGIVTTGSDTLGRINLWSTSRDVVGADNITVYDAPAALPTLRAAGASDDVFSFTLEGQAGQRYAILAGNSVGIWNPLQTNLLSGGSTILTFPIENSTRFFRAQWVP